MKISRHVVVVVGVAAAVVSLGAAVLRARQNPPASGLADGSVAGLTAEVRALRVVIEESAKTQAQVQGISAYLSAQKDRMLQTMSRLDAARKDTLAAAEQTARSSRELAAFEKDAADPQASPRQREALAENAQALKKTIERLKTAEQEVRTRETLAEQDVQSEQMRWNELVSRLEALIRK